MFAKIARLSPLALSALALSTSAVLAAPAIGLSGNTTLTMFDTESLEVSGTMEVTGVDGLAGIDVRPADKMLYGVSLAGEIVTIDTATGVATVKNTLSEMLPSFEGAIVDFNPMADRLRLMGIEGTNFRVNPDDGVVTVDGSLAFDEGDMHVGETPTIVAAAYTNSIGKPEATAMYDIDATIVALIQQVSPNDGTLATIGKLGIEGANNSAFDIASTKDLINTAYLVAGGTLYTIDLDSGAATDVGAVKGAETFHDIAILQ
jgi:hypothetical protein